jgi:two-component system cell cycle sensor histidine kinase/response regulator CckA
METDRQRKRILLVDDEREVRCATKMLLEFSDYEVVEAENGLKALEAFEQQSFDLIVTDFRMDQMNGGQLATKVKQIAPALPIIMVTGYHDEVPAGVVDVILDKPFSWDELRRTIKRLLEPANKS